MDLVAIILSLKSYLKGNFTIEIESESDFELVKDNLSGMFITTYKNEIEGLDGIKIRKTANG